MKTFTCILLVLWSTLTILPAQTAADYHLPLQMGNGLVYRSGEAGSSWTPRTVYETIEGTDSIHGNLYYKLVGSEIMDDTPTSRHVFHVCWLREDSLGNVLLIAGGGGESTDLDSATVYPMAYPYFHNLYLEQGYCQDTVYMGTSYHDSIMSISETVLTPAGTFYNCIKRREFRCDSLGNTTWLKYSWYAEDVGEVKLERVTPDPHINLLTQINFQTDVENIVPAEYSLRQNYPNPFNPQTAISYQLSADSHVELSVFDVRGKFVCNLINDHQTSGVHTINFNAGDLASGIYIYTLQAGDGIVKTKKMVLIK